MVITNVATVKIREGMMEEAKKVLIEVVKKVKETEPGTLEYTPHTVRNEDNTIIFIEKDTDEDAFKAHRANLGKNMIKFLPFMEPGPPITKICYPIE